MKCILLLIGSLGLLAQQRDAPTQPAPVGNAQITGVVMSAESQPQPMRRAVVTITGGVPTPRSVITDDSGRFTFNRLPAGTFSVTARKAAYIAASYGARRPGRAGMPVVLANGQRVDLAITMFRGAVIAGVLRDSAGAPVPNVDVRAIDARTLQNIPENVLPDLATTDDRGAFRIFGLLPGEYFVVALPFSTSQGETASASQAYVDSALAALTARQSAPPGVAPPALPGRLGTAGFAPIYYPGTVNHAEAARVRIESGEERSVSFEVGYVPMGAIDGVVTGNVPNLAAVRVALVPSNPRVTTFMSSTSVAGRAIDAEGRFRYSNLPPGRYRVVARFERSIDPAAAALPTVTNNAVSGRGGGGITPTPAVTTSAGTPVEIFFGFADVELRGEDAVNVTLALQPGGTITGRIVLAGDPATPRPEGFAGIRTTLSLEGASGSVSSNGITIGTNIISSAPSTVRSDGAFEIRGIGPGRFTFNAAFATAADAGPWRLRSVTAGGRNLLDESLELGPGTDMKDVVVTFSDMRTEIAGSLLGASGQPATEYFIVAMPADRALWRPRSRRIVSVRPSTDGRFVLADIPSGEYLIAALTDVDPLDLQDASFLDQIAPATIRVTVRDGEKKVQDIRIR